MGHKRKIDRDFLDAVAEALPSVQEHKSGVIKVNKPGEIGWRPICSCGYQAREIFGTPQHARNWWEDHHALHHMEPEEVEAKKQEEQAKFEARKRQILDQFVG